MSGRKPSLGFLLIVLHEAICRKGIISPKPLEAVSVLCKSMASSNGGLSSFKGAGMLPLGKLIQSKLAQGGTLNLEQQQKSPLTRIYPGLISSEEGGD